MLRQAQSVRRAVAGIFLVREEANGQQVKPHKDKVCGLGPGPWRSADTWLLVGGQRSL